MTSTAGPDRPWGRDAPSSLANRVRARDVRVPYVERAFLARQLGLGRDDLDLLPDAAVEALLNTPTSVMNVIGAERLLEHLDAAVAREHPVDLDYLASGNVRANVPQEFDATIELELVGGARIHLDQTVLTPDDTEHDNHLDLTPDDAEALAYALLRLVEHQRAAEPPTEFTDQVIGTDNGPRTEENR